MIYCCESCGRDTRSHTRLCENCRPSWDEAMSYNWSSIKRKEQLRKEKWLDEDDLEDYADLLYPDDSDAEGEDDDEDEG